MKFCCSERMCLVLGLCYEKENFVCLSLCSSSSCYVILILEKTVFLRIHAKWVRQADDLVNDGGELRKN